MPRARSSISVLLLVAGAVLLAGCGTQPESITEEGDSVATLYTIVTILAVIIFVGVEAAIIVFPIRYRRRRDDDGSLPEQIHGNNTLEVLWTVIPAIIVLVLFVLSYQVIRTLQDTTPAPELEEQVEAQEAVRIDVVGRQWAWDFAYPDFTWEEEDPLTGETIDVPVTITGSTGAPNTIEDTAQGQGVPVFKVPIDSTIHFALRSDNVIHSLYIPQSLFKLDVVPGRTNRFEVTFTETGVFYGQCAELCGTSHAQMIFYVEVLEVDEFFDWADEQVEEGEAAYEELQEELLAQAAEVAAEEVAEEVEAATDEAGTEDETAGTDEDATAEETAGQ